MKSHETLNRFEAAYAQFNTCIQDLLEELLLAPMSGWTPHAVVAHLTGWNRNMIIGCRNIIHGITPYYYADASHNYSNINALFVAIYQGWDKTRLLKELAIAKAELVAFLVSLEPNEWEADHGVIHHRGGAATIKLTIDSLSQDYLQHAREISAFAIQMGVQGKPVTTKSDVGTSISG